MVYNTITEGLGGGGGGGGGGRFGFQTLKRNAGNLGTRSLYGLGGLGLGPKFRV